MEYPFKDLMPLDEVLEREGYYKDWTHLDPEVFYSLTQISEYIKTKGFGVDVRLLIAQLAEHFGLRVTQITDAMGEFGDLKAKVEELITKSDQSALKADQSVKKSDFALTNSQNALNVANGIDAKATNALNLSTSADTLSKSVQEQFNQVVIDGDSSVEAAQARVDANGVTKPTLKQRLDDDYNEVSTQLTHGVGRVEQRTIFGGLHQHRRRKPMLTIVDDDGYPQVHSRLLPLAKELDIPMVSGVITKGLQMSMEQLKELQANGIEIVSHSHTHRYVTIDNMTEEEVRDCYRTARDFLLENGFTHDIFVIPGGSHNAMSRRVAQEFYRASINIDPSIGENVNYPPLKQHAMSRIDFNSRGVAYTKQKLDEAVANDGWVILMTHVYSDSWTDDDMREVVNYAKSIGVDIVNLTDGLNAMGNILNVGDSANLDNDNTSVIDSDGNVHGTNLGVFVRRDNSVKKRTNASLPSEFPSEKVSMINVSQSFANSAGFPTGYGGVLLTYRPSTEDYYTSQEFWRAGSNWQRYRRAWDVGTNSWGKWEPFVNYRTLADDTRSESDGLGWYTDDITYQTVTVDKGWINGYGGFVETYRTGRYQTFKRFNSNDLFIRYAPTQIGTWQPWVRLMQGGYELKKLPYNFTLAPGQLRILDFGSNDARVNNGCVVNPLTSLPSGVILTATSINLGFRLSFYNTSNEGVTIPTGTEFACYLIS